MAVIRARAIIADVESGFERQTWSSERQHDLADEVREWSRFNLQHLQYRRPHLGSAPKVGTAGMRQCAKVGHRQGISTRRKRQTCRELQVQSSAPRSVWGHHQPTTTTTTVVHFVRTRLFAYQTPGAS